MPQDRRAGPASNRKHNRGKRLKCSAKGCQQTGGAGGLALVLCKQCGRTTCLGHRFPGDHKCLNDLRFKPRQPPKQAAAAPLGGGAGKHRSGRGSKAPRYAAAPPANTASAHRTRAVPVTVASAHRQRGQQRGQRAASRLQQLQEYRNLHKARSARAGDPAKSEKPPDQKGGAEVLSAKGAEGHDLPHVTDETLQMNDRQQEQDAWCQIS